MKKRLDKKVERFILDNGIYTVGDVVLSLALVTFCIIIFGFVFGYVSTSLIVYTAILVIVGYGWKSLERK